MFYTIRAIIGIVLFITCLIIINKKRFFAHKRRLTIVSFIIVLLLTTVTVFVPVENLFINLDLVDGTLKPFENQYCQKEIHISVSKNSKMKLRRQWIKSAKNITG